MFVLFFTRFGTKLRVVGLRKAGEAERGKGQRAQWGKKSPLGVLEGPTGEGGGEEVELAWSRVQPRPPTQTEQTSAM